MPKPKAAAPEVPAVEPFEKPVIGQQPEQPVEPAQPMLTEHANEQHAAAPEVPALIKVRILANCEHGAPNDIVEIDAALVKSLVGVVDADPAAVAYAESLE